MRRTLVSLALGALFVAGCGRTTPLDFKGKSRPAAPVDVSIYVNNHHLLISPSSVGAGPVDFTVANQSCYNETVWAGVLHEKGAITVSGPVPSDATAQISVTMHPGVYVLQADSYGNARCERESSVVIRGAKLRVGGPSRSGDSALLQP